MQTKNKGAKAPTPKSVLMRRLREERKAKGLVKLEIWDTTENCEKTKQFNASLKT
jgi:hypothetical protein